MARKKKRKRKQSLDAKIEKSIKTMDIILLVIGILLTAFTVTMIWIYVSTGGIPEVLCSCVFTTLGGECGVMGWIKTNKRRYYNRELDKENGRPSSPFPDDPPSESDAIGFDTNNFNSEEEDSDE